jgi:cation:H+ antiporter
VTLPLWLHVLLFIVAGLVITRAGTRLVRVADQLADCTGIGEAMTGALFLGASTSLPGITPSVAAAWNGHAELAMSNAVGGIAAQTAFLGIADCFNREANLEHQAASLPNILNGTLVITLLGTVLLTTELPAVTIFGVHPITPVLFMAYGAGMHLVRRCHRHPQWRPRWTRLTRPDEPDPAPVAPISLGRLLMIFGGLAGVLALAGWVVAYTGVALAQQTGLAESFVGGLFTAVATSMPELVTAIAAVRQGALTLAVGDIIGGNAFDVLFAAAADLVYRNGSIYHAISHRERFLMALAIVMTGVLVMGLVSREERGVANIGFESFLILLLYAAGVVFLALNQTA